MDYDFYNPYLLQYVGILYDSGRTGNGRWLELTLKERDGHDGNDGYINSTAHEKMPS